MKYTPILKTKKGEFDAIARFLEYEGSKYTQPFFDLTYPNEKELKGSTPFLDYVEEKTNEIKSVLGCGKHNQLQLIHSTFDKFCFIDNHYWPDADKILENNEHPLEYLVNSLIDSDIKVVPIIGFERWDEMQAPHYIRALKNISQIPEIDNYSLRIDKDDIIDFAKYEPDSFIEQILSIIDGVETVPEKMNIIFDFRYISDRTTFEDNTSYMISLLRKFNFKSYVLAGSSIPKFISEVTGKNSTNTVSRTEMLSWKTISSRFSNLQIGFADYGVRNPETSDNIKNKYINGKIWYTINESYFVVRGSSLYQKFGSIRGDEFRTLSQKIVDSGYWSNYSNNWGDKEIFNSLFKPITSLGTWVSVSTSRHLSYVSKEVLEHQVKVKNTESIK